MLGSRQIRVAALDDLIAMKRVAARPQDLIDIENSRPSPGDAVKTDPDAPQATNAEWSADFRAAEDHALDASLAATPSQRLAWLEEALAFALRVGALPRPDDETGERNGVPLMPQRPKKSQRPNMDDVIAYATSIDTATSERATSRRNLRRLSAN